MTIFVVDSSKAVMENGKEGQLDAFAWAEQARLEAEAAKVRKMLTLYCSGQELPMMKRTYHVAQRIQLPEILIADDDSVADLKRMVVAALALPKLFEPRFYRVDGTLVDNLHHNEETTILRKVKAIKDKSKIEFRIIEVEEVSSSEESSLTDDD